MIEPALSDELRYTFFKELEQTPNLSQRELAKVADISLGKANYCLKALITAGWVKAGNFAKGEICLLLTSKGFSERAEVTLRFLAKKQRQYEALELEIAELKNEVVEKLRETNN